MRKIHFMPQYQTFNNFILIAVLSMVLGLAACGPKVETGGYVTHEDIKTLITPGKSTKDDVQKTLGSPSSQSTFGDDAWYYITDRKESYAFLKFDTVEQNVVRIAFDDNGLVTKVEDYDLSKSEDIQIVKRETATEGHTLGFLEQMLGNIGRFNAPGGGAGTVAGRPGPGGGLPGR